MKHRLPILIFALLGFIIPMRAQADNSKEKIVAIKSDTTYLFVNGTSTLSEQEAEENARRLLTEEIESWLMQNGADPTRYVAISGNHMDVIQSRIGKVYKCFAYVNKNDILSLAEGEQIITTAPQKPAQPAPQPESKPAPKPEPQPQPAPAPVAKPQPTPAEQPAASPAPALPDDDEAEPPFEGAPFDIDIYNPLSKTHTWKRFVAFLNQLKSEGKIFQTGDASNLPSSGNVYIVVTDYNDIVRANLFLRDNEMFNPLEGAHADLQEVLSKCPNGRLVWFRTKRPGRD